MLPCLLKIAKYQNEAIDGLAVGDLGKAHNKMRAGSTALLEAVVKGDLPMKEAIEMYCCHIFRAGYFTEVEEGMYAYRTDAVPQQLLNGLHFQIDGKGDGPAAPSGYDRKATDPAVRKYAVRAMKLIEESCPWVLLQIREEKRAYTARKYPTHALKFAPHPQYGTVIHPPTTPPETIHLPPRRLSPTLLSSNYTPTADLVQLVAASMTNP